jgi:hypothetical protein
MILYVFLALAAIFLFIYKLRSKKSQLKPPVTETENMKFEYNAILCYNSLACGMVKVVSFFTQLFMKGGGKLGEGLAEIKNKKSDGVLPERQIKFA